ncbi:MAG TPA: pyruvate dehydrogenase (acetyl-transferring), homodimeric type, partial [Acidobacteriota bacterium]|nr:pyruvate dehydrogenase (acetyl-transferring), homodimeric type [Acidobacteriota bacterium]
LNETLKAQRILEENYGIPSEVWSVTSYKELHRDGIDVERWNMLHPSEKPRVSYLGQTLGGTQGVVVAASDYVKALPDMISRWIRAPFFSLGTNGFGRSDTRKYLRDFFEVDARYIVIATLSTLMRQCKVKSDVVKQAIKDLDVNPEKANPMIS